MTDQAWLGADLGTQSLRVVAVDDNGKVLSRAARPLTGSRSGSRHEQDPNQWWGAFAAAAGEAVAALGNYRIGGIAVDATSGTILLADPDGNPITPGLMYDDVRDPGLAARVDEAGQSVWHELGYQHMQPSWALPTLVWLCENDPATKRSGTRLLHQADFITWRLAGHQLAADASHALKTGYHLIAERWPDEVLETLCVPTALMPDVRRPGTVIGAVGAGAAETTGIPEGTPIVAGMTDGCAAQLGAGALEPGAWNSVLGTTLVLKGVSDHLVRDPRGVVYCHRGPDDTWLPGGASSSGAGALTRLLPGADFDALTATAATRAPSAVAYPLAGERGERFPLRAPDLEPFALGETSDDADTFAAVLLGVACVERLCFDYLNLLGASTDGPLTFTGGGSKNRYWAQLRADLLGRTAQLPADADSAAGMALLAASGATGRPLAATAESMVHVGDSLIPDPERRPVLIAQYLRFIDHLTQLGHLEPEVAEHAHRRAEP